MWSNNEYGKLSDLTGDTRPKKNHMRKNKKKKKEKKISSAWKKSLLWMKCLLDSSTEVR